MMIINRISKYWEKIISREKFTVKDVNTIMFQQRKVIYITIVLH